MSTARRRVRSVTTTWASRITDLRKSGMTLAEIGNAVGLSLSSICDIECARTAEPRGDAAVKLHELHRSRCSEARAAT